jgi:hypothetical protein
MTILLSVQQASRTDISHSPFEERRQFDLCPHVGVRGGRMRQKTRVRLMCRSKSSRWELQAGVPPYPDHQVSASPDETDKTETYRTSTLTPLLSTPLTPKTDLQCQRKTVCVASATSRTMFEEHGR